MLAAIKLIAAAVVSCELTLRLFVDVVAADGAEVGVVAIVDPAVKLGVKPTVDAVAVATVVAVAEELFVVLFKFGLKQPLLRELFEFVVKLTLKFCTLLVKLLKFDDALRDKFVGLRLLTFVMAFVRAFVIAFVIAVVVVAFDCVDVKRFEFEEFKLDVVPFKLATPLRLVPAAVKSALLKLLALPLGVTVAFCIMLCCVFSQFQTVSSTDGDFILSKPPP